MKITKSFLSIIFSIFLLKSSFSQSIDGTWLGINCDYGQTDEHKIIVKNIDKKTKQFECSLNDGTAEYWFKSNLKLNSKNEFIGAVKLYQGDSEIPNCKIRFVLDNKYQNATLYFITKLGDICFDKGVKFKKSNQKKVKLKGKTLRIVHNDYSCKIELPPNITLDFLKDEINYDTRGNNTLDFNALQINHNEIKIGTIYSRNLGRTDGLTIEEQFNNALLVEGRTIEFKILGKNYYILKGHVDGQRFCLKKCIGNGYLSILYLKFNDNSIDNELLEKLITSFSSK